MSAAQQNLCSFPNVWGILTKVFVKFMIYMLVPRGNGQTQFTMNLIVCVNKGDIQFHDSLCSRSNGHGQPMHFTWTKVLATEF